MTMSVEMKKNLVKQNSETASAMQDAVHRRLSGSQRLAIAIDMSLIARELAIAGLKHRHPDWSEETIRKELLRQQFPRDKIPPPLR